MIERKEKVDPKERGGPKENRQILVTLGDKSWYSPIGTAKRMVLRRIRGQLLNLFLISARSA